jgi:hypothetical protein
MAAGSVIQRGQGHGTLNDDKNKKKNGAADAKHAPMRVDGKHQVDLNFEAYAAAHPPAAGAAAAAGGGAAAAAAGGGAAAAAAARKKQEDDEKRRQKEEEKNKLKTGLYRDVPVPEDGGNIARDFNSAVKNLLDVQNGLGGRKEPQSPQVENETTAAITSTIQFRVPKADFGTAILDSVREVVSNANKCGYSIENDKVREALDRLIVAHKSLDYTPQLGLVQAGYGTFDSSKVKLSAGK